MSSAPTSPKSRTDWDRVDALRDEDIDLSDSPEITPTMFSRAVARRGRKPAARREKLTLYIDADVISWFKTLGEGYPRQINAILRAYKEAHQRA